MTTLVKVISLSSATQRRQEFAAMAGNECPVPWEFFDAHTKQSLLLEYDPEAAIRAHGRVLSDGELGCYSSHFELWTALVEDETADQYVVLEDDVVVNWPYLAKIIERNAQDDGYGYLRLFWKYPSRQIVRTWHWASHDTFVVQLLGQPFGTQGYVVTKSGARSLINACRTVVRPIDDQMDRYWEHQVLNFAVFPPALFEKWVPSSIGSMRYGKTEAKPAVSSQFRDKYARILAELRARILGVRRR